MILVYGLIACWIIFAKINEVKTENVDIRLIDNLVIVVLSVLPNVEWLYYNWLNYVQYLFELYQ
ncbi:hypothetical protein V1477_009341 [Vespula maculifrons]|uniref:Uncharacterized protein n=1 Tax=Vespula maculifrons TaxID=7453 RepID=A0ABD2C9H3_VESMC